MNSLYVSFRTSPTVQGGLTSLIGFYLKVVFFLKYSNH